MFAFFIGWSGMALFELRLEETREAISLCSINHSFIQELELVLSQFPIIFQTSLRCTLTLINDLQVLLGKSRRKIHSTDMCCCYGFILQRCLPLFQCRHSGSLN